MNYWAVISNSFSQQLYTDLVVTSRCHFSWKKCQIPLKCQAESQPLLLLHAQPICRRKLKGFDKIFILTHPYWFLLLCLEEWDLGWWHRWVQERQILVSRGRTLSVKTVFYRTPVFPLAERESRQPQLCCSEIQFVRAWRLEVLWSELMEPSCQHQGAIAVSQCLPVRFFLIKDHWVDTFQFSAGVLTSNSQGMQSLKTQKKN